MRRDADNSDERHDAPEVEVSVWTDGEHPVPVAPGEPATTRTPYDRLVAAIAILVVVAAGAFVIGDRHGRAASTAAAHHEAPTQPGPRFATAMTATADRCLVQTGKRVQLGAELLNQSTTNAAEVRDIKLIIPNGGVAVQSARWGACGLITDGIAGPVQPKTIPPGGAAWYSIVVDLLLACPATIPVEFRLTYAMGNETDIAELNVFPAIVGVTYDDCPAGSSGPD